MTAASIRSSFSLWPKYDQRLRAAVARLTEAELAIQPSPDRWPIWATVGHLACQRVFWLCDFAGEPGADETPFPSASFNCPGDDDLENFLDARALVAALESTFAIVERCLDSWTIASLDNVIRRPEFGPEWVKTRGEVIQRVYSHDVWHAGQLAQTLGIHGLAKPDFWD